MAHIHEREVGHHTGVPVAFMPHVASWFQGIHLTVSAQLAAGGPPPTRAALAAHFAAFYAGERLVRVLADGTPDVRTHGSGVHGVTLGGFAVDEASGRVVVV